MTAGLPEERPEDSGEYRCPECGRKVTLSPSGREYGHARKRGDQFRCNRRKEYVDPDKPGSVSHGES
jgi:DNA-directed RNA polymerase subunit RPC12/RpoP